MSGVDETSADLSLNLKRWAKASYWTLEEMEYLLAGLDHWEVKKIDPGVPLDLKDKERRAIREALAFEFRGVTAPGEVTPEEALKIAVRADLPVPEDLERAVREAVEASAAAAEARKNAARSRDEGKLNQKYTKLLKVFLAVAIDGYGYRRDKPRQGAIVDIGKAADDLNIKIDDETIRARLREAYDALDPNEETGVQGRWARP